MENNQYFGSAPFLRVPAPAAKARGWNVRRAWQCMVLAAAGMVAVASAQAAITGNWTTSGSSSASTNVLGITIGVGGASSSNYANTNFNSTNFWSDPYGSTVAGGNGVELTTPASTTATTYTFTFNEPVDNPVLHVDKLGGIASNVSNTSQWTLVGNSSQGGTVSMTRLSGNTPFQVSGSQFYRTTGASIATVQGECENSNAGTACGSIRFNGTGITSLSFAVVMVGGVGLGDGIRFRWSLEGSSLIVRKQSVNGTGSFNFRRTGATGNGNFSLVTTGSTPVSSATYTVNDHTQAITVNETSLPNDYLLTSASCVDQRGNTVNSTRSGNSLTIPAADYGANQTITCTFLNTRQVPNVAVVKTASPASVASGGLVTYTLTVSNPGPMAVTNPVLTDTVGAGQDCTTPSTTAGCSASGGATCPGGASSGTVAVSALTGTGVTIPSLPSGGQVVVTLQCRVTATGQP